MAEDSPKYMYFKLQFKNDVRKLTVPNNASHKDILEAACSLYQLENREHKLLYEDDDVGFVDIHTDTKLSNKMTLRIKKGKLIS